MASADSEENPYLENESVLSVSAFFSENYSLFAVAGVLAALSVYMRDFRSASPSGSVEFGVVSSLLMFSLVSVVLLYKTVNQAMTVDVAEPSRVVGYSTLIVGIGGLLYSILSVTVVFQSQLVRIVDIGFVVGGLSSYFIWLSNSQFSTADRNVSEQTADAIENIPAAAALATLITYISADNMSPSLVQSFTQFGFSGQSLYFPRFWAAVITHAVWCWLLKHYFVFRDSHNTRSLDNE